MAKGTNGSTAEVAGTEAIVSVWENCIRMYPKTQPLSCLKKKKKTFYSDRGHVSSHKQLVKYSVPFLATKNCTLTFITELDDFFCQLLESLSGWLCPKQTQAKLKHFFQIIIMY